MADKQQKTENNGPEGVTTRDDKNDLGVKMLAGSPDEPTGPEDALGKGPKRGDYSDRIGPSNYLPHTADGEGGALEAQRPRAAEVGEVEGRKGGVDSAQK